MRRPLWLRVALVTSITLCAALTAGCGGGGDSRPPTIVTGNVRSVSATAALHRPRTLWSVVRSWWNAAALAQVPGVTVAIENRNNSTSTDEQGLFRLEGDQLGPVVLQFAGAGFSARLPVTLPAGGELDLIDVDVIAGDVKVAEQRIQFDGPITGVDCQGSLLQVLSGAQVPFRVRLKSNTVITDEKGAPLRCVDLVSGTAEVAGTVDDNGDVTAVSLQVNPVVSLTPGPEDVVQGSITALHCPVDLTVAASSGNVTVNLGTGTVIKDTNGSTIACGDLSTGDSVRARGTLGSFGLAASEVDRLAAATPTPTAGPTPTSTPGP